MSVVRVRTAAWYGDRELELHFPPGWDVATLWPDTPPPLSDEQIERAVRSPVGQPQIAELARSAQDAVVILDDLTRPTPTDRILPFVLRELEAGGVPPSRVALVIGTGTHGVPDSRALAKKAGSEAAGACHLVAHDDRAHDLVALGRTSFGTPVVVNSLVARSDYVLGIGGVYPQHSTGFGGGAKLALGVLGRRSITHLHYGHPSVNGRLEIDNDFRHDLSEIARMIRLRTSIGANVDARRQIVRLACGSHDEYYASAAAFARSAYAAPGPGDADVVIANAYPMDVSLTFMRSKGILPLLQATPGASRIIVSACPEGAGHHGLFPFVDRPRFDRGRQIARRMLVRPRAAPALAATAVAQRLRPASQPPRARPLQPIHLYAPGKEPGGLPEEIPGMTAAYTWGEVLARVASEQGRRGDLRAIVYPCAPLQVVGG